MGSKKRSALFAEQAQLQERPNVKKRKLMDKGASNKHGSLNVTTRGARRASLRGAAEAVFLTTELLEQVLRHLPEKQLLVAQRVCRKFRNVISESRALQQKLFLSPIDQAFGTKRSARYEDAVRPMTAMSKPLVKRFQTSNPAVTLAWQHNPMLFEENNCWHKWHPAGDECMGQSLRFRKSILASMLYPEASWRRMYSTQPPFGLTGVWCTGERTAHPIAVEAGVRASDLASTGVDLGNVFVCVGMSVMLDAAELAGI